MINFPDSVLEKTIKKALEKLVTLKNFVLPTNVPIQKIKFAFQSLIV